MRPFATFCLALPLLLTARRFVLIFKCNVLENVNCAYLLISNKKTGLCGGGGFFLLIYTRGGSSPKYVGGQTKRRKIVKIQTLSRRSAEPFPENFEILELIWCILAHIQEDFSSKWRIFRMRYFYANYCRPMSFFNFFGERNMLWVSVTIFRQV